MDKALRSTLLPVSATVLAVVCFVILFGGKAHGAGTGVRKIVVFDHAPIVVESARLVDAVMQSGGS